MCGTPPLPCNVNEKLIIAETLSHDAESPADARAHNYTECSNNTNLKSRKSRVTLIVLGLLP